MKKKCNNCHLTKNIKNNFRLRNSSSVKYYNVCKECENKNKRDNYNKNRNNHQFIARKIVKKAKERLKEKKSKIILETTGKKVIPKNVRLDESDFNITPEWCLQQKELQNNKCMYSGIEMEWSIGYIASGNSLRLNPKVVSIDRINSLLGYTEDNCVLVCWKANCFKGDGDVSEMIEFSAAIMKKLTG